MLLKLFSREVMAHRPSGGREDGEKGMGGEETWEVNMTAVGDLLWIGVEE